MGCDKMTPTVKFRPHLSLLSIVIINFLLYEYYSLQGEAWTQQTSPGRRRRRRLPDVLIMGVKKSGTITLDTFLKYHPNLAVRGEFKFFVFDDLYKQGPKKLVEKMPLARSDQLIVAKSSGIWFQPNVRKILLRHKAVLPKVKMLLIVRGPIVRLVSDILQYNLRHGANINVNDIVLNTKHQRQPYYGFRKDLTIREALMLLSNFSNIWDTFTAIYPKEQILLVDGDLFTENPAVILQEIERFLGLPHFFREDHFVFTGKKGYPCFKLDLDTADRCM